jgi:prolyl 4-hydroxylase
MFSYIVGFVAFLILFYNPLLQLLSTGTPRIHRIPRPQMNTDRLALEQNTGNETAIQCPQDSYAVHVFSREPLVLYIEGFLLPGERAHLLDVWFVSHLSACVTATTRTLPSPIAAVWGVSH